jgi:hypothetical protein
MTLIETCSALIQLPPESTDIFGQSTESQPSSDSDRHTMEASTVLRVPRAHYRMERAIEALKTRIPESMRGIVEILSVGGNSKTVEPIAVVNIDNYALVSLILSTL